MSVLYTNKEKLYKKKIMDEFTNYEVLSIIGSGSFGTCYRVKNKTSSKEFVWKAVAYGKMSEEKKQLLVSEVNLLSKLKHPNIVRYYDHIIHKKSFTLYIIMEYCSGGDLSKIIKMCKENSFYIEELFIWKVLYQISLALELCHEQCSVTVLHRDIKPANVFIDADHNVKLGDFGLAKIMDDKENFTNTIVGTPLYMSPELVRNKKYNTKSDVWALGCLIYELSALKAPFIANVNGNLKDMIKKGKYEKIPEIYTEELQSIINLLLNTDPNTRPSIHIILHHPTVLAKSTQTFKNIMCKKNICNHDINLDSITKESLQARLENIRSREAFLKAREEKLEIRERNILKREKKIAVLERLANEKMLRADLYLRRSKENKSNHRSRSRIKSPERNMDESLSADPGDTSILPTSTKMNEEQILRPKVFVRTFSERRVHFNQKKVFENNSDEVVFKEYFFDNAQAVSNEKNKKKNFGLNVLKSFNSKISQSSSSIGSKSSSNASEIIQSEVKKMWTKENKKCAFTLLKNMNSDSEKENVHTKICHTQM